MWKIWCKALGEKASPEKKDADKVAIVRTIILSTYLITNCFIISGVIRHWNNSGTTIWICADKPNDAYWCSRR